MILYFTGTGNSRYVARVLANELEDELVSINQLMKEGFNGTLTSDKPFVVVTPTYCWRMPLVVEEFLKNISYEGNKNMYITLSCDTGTGAAKDYAKKLVEHIGLNYMGFERIYMPENYIVMFPSVDENEAKEKIAKAEIKVIKTAHQIKQGKPLDQKKSWLIQRAATALINVWFYRFYVKPKGFHTTDACIGCKKCETVCPLNNIHVENGTPKWGENCTHCMACVSGCPKAAIEYKNKTKDKRRYYLD